MTKYKYITVIDGEIDYFETLEEAKGFIKEMHDDFDEITEDGWNGDNFIAKITHRIKPVHCGSDDDGSAICYFGLQESEE